MKNNRSLAWLKSRRVAVLKGGSSRERSISLRTGAAIEKSLKRLGVQAVGIDARRGFLQQLRKQKIDFCYIALHGTYGEDGGVQRDLDKLKIPYTGSGAASSALAMDKVRSKKRFIAKKIPTPAWVLLRKGQAVSNSLRQLLKTGPVFVKPSDQGSAIGASSAKNEKELKRALMECFRVSKTALIERKIEGREFTVGVLGKKALPVVEIVPKHAFYDFHSKYAAGGSRHLVPARLSKAATRTAQKISLRAFKALNCSAYGRIDLLMDKKGRFYVLEANTIPGMTNTSLLPDAARAAGLSFEQLVLKIVEFSRD